MPRNYSQRYCKIHVGVIIDTSRYNWFGIVQFKKFFFFKFFELYYNSINSKNYTFSSNLIVYLKAENTVGNDAKSFRT